MKLTIWSLIIKMKNILIYNSSFFYINTIKSRLEKQFSKVNFFVVDNIPEVKDLLFSVPFDLMILDVNFDSIDYFNLIETFENIEIKSKLLILSFINEDSFINYRGKIKVDFFLNKNCTEDVFNQVLHRIINKNKRPNVKSLKSKLTEISQKLTKKKTIRRLSKREIEIAKLLVNGIPNIEISKLLNLSMTTISTYKKRIMLKTETNNIIELSNYYKKRNIS